MNTLEVSKTYSQQIIDGIIPANDDVILSCSVSYKHFRTLNFITIRRSKTLVEFCQEFYLTEVSPPTLTVLQPFQIWLLANIYGIKYKDTQRRVCKIANVSVARGNAKHSLFVYSAFSNCCTELMHKLLLLVIQLKPVWKLIMTK